jgi:ribosomal protein S18 acetylase RimI-like enzyme
MGNSNELETWIQHWNSSLCPSLPITPAMLDQTFFSHPENQRGILRNDNGVLLYKVDEHVVRIHWISWKNDSFLTEAVSRARMAAMEYGKTKVIFGAGPKHLFPGVPLHKEFVLLLKKLSLWGEIHTDLILDFKDVPKLPIDPSYQLESNFRQSELKQFVEKEFQGRWLQEYLEDEKQNTLNHYKCFFYGEQLIGFAKSYGPTDGYLAPGIYWNAGNQKIAGISVLGLAHRLRGKGIGRKLLAAVLQDLQSKGFESVRVENTIDVAFFTKFGFKPVEKYQPAKIDVAGI